MSRSTLSGRGTVINDGSPKVVGKGRKRKLLSIMATIRQRAPLLVGRGTVASSAQVNPLPPVFTVSPTSATYQSTSLPQTIQFTATDPNGQTVSYGFVTTPSGYSIDSSTGLVTVAAGASSQSFRVRATDAGGLSADSDTCAVTVQAAATGTLLHKHLSEQATPEVSGATDWGFDSVGTWPLEYMSVNGFYGASRDYATEGLQALKLKVLNNGYGFRSQVKQAYFQNQQAFMSFFQDYWIGFAVRPNPDWKPSQYRESWWDVHDSNDAVPTGRNGIISLNCYGRSGYDYADRAGQWGIEYCYDQTTNGTGQVTLPICLMGAPVVDAWTYFVFRLNFDWRTGGGGLVQCWKNGTQIINYSGPFGYNDPTGPYFKFGPYKWDWPKSGGVPIADTDATGTQVTQRTVYFDEVRIAGADGNFALVTPRGTA